MPAERLILVTGATGCIGGRLPALLLIPVCITNTTDTPASTGVPLLQG
jgi:nucleoside-diphosphate-sugar epimerase